MSISWSTIEAILGETWSDFGSSIVCDSLSDIFVLSLVCFVHTAAISCHSFGIASGVHFVSCIAILLVLRCVVVWICWQMRSWSDIQRACHHAISYAEAAFAIACCNGCYIWEHWQPFCCYRFGNPLRRLLGSSCRDAEVAKDYSSLGAKTESKAPGSWRRQ